MFEKLKKLFNNWSKNIHNLDELFETLGEHTIDIEIGEDIIPLYNAISKTIKNFRISKKDKTGFIFPLVYCYSNINLQENELVIKIQGKIEQNLFIIPNEKNLEKELNTALEEIYNNHIEDIFTYELLEEYFDYIRKKIPLTFFHIRIMYSTNEIREILIQLLKSKKSIKNIYYILGKIAETSLQSGFYSHIFPIEIAKRITSNL